MKKEKKNAKRNAEYVVCGNNYCGGSYWLELTEEEVLQGIRRNGNQYKYIFKIVDKIPVRVEIDLGEKGEVICQEMN